MLKKEFIKSKQTYKVKFSLPVSAAENAREVKLLGEFNHWNREAGIVMDKATDNYTTELELAGGKNYQFRYLIDNHRWENDWEADDYHPTPYGVKNSVVSLKVKEKSVARPTSAIAKGDDLKRIEGIGPKMAEVLTQNGIDTFAKLAKATPSYISEVLTNANNRYRRYDTTTWPEQAKFAVAKDWVGLAAWQKNH